ncbi:MAG: hypothetical protein ABSG51_18245 [Terracidiphilus sp.]|jgi:hypothetical protein
MILIKKIDVEKHFAAKRAIRRAGALSVSRPVAPTVTEARTIGPTTNAKNFAEDFSTEHSSKGPASPSQ